MFWQKKNQYPLYTVTMLFSLLLLTVVFASDVDSFPKLAAQLVPGDALFMGDEPANVTDVSIEDDGTLTIIGLGLITNEFYEKQLDQADVVDVSTAEVSQQKVRKITEDDFVELEDSEGNVTDDAEMAPDLRDKLASALKLKQNVKVATLDSGRVAILIEDDGLRLAHRGPPFEPTMEQWLLQLTLAVAMFVTTAVAGFIPVKITKCLAKKGEGANDKGAKWLSLLSCFSGGVFMATCFLDIIPHINETYEEYKHDLAESRGQPELEIEFPFPQLFTCIGFFLVYFIEEICVRVFSMGHSHGGRHSHEAPPPIENDFVRRGSVNLRNTEPDLLLETNPEDKLQQALPYRFSMVMEETANYAVAAKSEVTLLKSLTFAVAMSFHSVLEGFALGVQSNIRSIMTLFISLLVHKGIEAFSVGLQVSRGNSDRMKAVATTILIYALMTPLGSGIGTVLKLSHIDPLLKNGVVLVLESLAAGTFIYVTFLEVLAQEKDNGHNSLIQLLAIFLGFAAIAGIQLIFGEHGHEEHSHDHAHHAIEQFLTTVMTPLTTK